MGRGRAPKGEYAGKTQVMSFRLTPDTKAALRRAAARSGRSLSQETEHRLRRGLDEEEAISSLWGVSGRVNPRKGGVIAMSRWSAVDRPGHIPVHAFR
jgi:TraY domain